MTAEQTDILNDVRPGDLLTLAPVKRPKTVVTEIAADAHRFGDEED